MASTEVSGAGGPFTFSVASHHGGTRIVKSFSGTGIAVIVISLDHRVYAREQEKGSKTPVRRTRFESFEAWACVDSVLLYSLLRRG